jgi:hypothetical protein
MNWKKRFFEHECLDVVTLCIWSNDMGFLDTICNTIRRWVGQLTLNVASERLVTGDPLVCPISSTPSSRTNNREMNRSQKNGHYSEYANPTHPTKNACHSRNIKWLSQLHQQHPSLLLFVSAYPFQYHPHQRPFA